MLITCQPRERTSAGDCMGHDLQSAVSFYEEPPAQLRQILAQDNRGLVNLECDSCPYVTEKEVAHTPFANSFALLFGFVSLCETHSNIRGTLTHTRFCGSYCTCTLEKKYRRVNKRLFRLQKGTQKESLKSGKIKRLLMSIGKREKKLTYPQSLYYKVPARTLLEEINIDYTGPRIPVSCRGGLSPPFFLQLRHL